MNAYDIVGDMLHTTNQIKGMTFIVVKSERIEGEMNTQESFTKLERNPFKIYVKQDESMGGFEVLYVENEYNGKLLVNPNGFPWFTLKLDPKGNMVRRGQHHTIMDSGFDEYLRLYMHLVHKYKDVEGSLIISGTDYFQSKACWIVEFVNPDYNLVHHEVKLGEKPKDIADKYMLSEFMVLDHNEDLDDYESEIDLDKIIVPNDYAKRIVMLIEKERKVPVHIKIYDDEGIYEEYLFKSLDFNQSFTNTDFSSENPRYGF